MAGDPAAPPGPVTYTQVGGGCFVGSTPVLMADGTERPIAAIATGDAVMAFDGVGKLEPRRVIKTWVHDEMEVLELAGVRCTAPHRFLTEDGGYVPALALNGHKLVRAVGALVANGGVKPVAGNDLTSR